MRLLINITTIANVKTNATKSICVCNKNSLY